ncbi:DUF2793 domain-containing protein [Sulfitobacter albidus]|uniref:DUF2793 domain-containing protein n=1 Tax=Sulfitobacter albidus TaxID=2829501 RepID=A0A975PLS8_9RHOB|nr:DUF2793 domain-containing protein [Sulfitobacter albidus]QUJ76038.1 DUF2793 domain-containing protein [Sulfitobacter albidus]
MSDTSPRLSLPLIAPAQAQKHVTHNEALTRLDVLAQLTLEGVEAETPPVTPQEGDVWALGASPSGDWTGQAGTLAAYVNGAWLFITPAVGWQAVNISDGSQRVWSGGAWDIPGTVTLDNVEGIGINASFDAFNRLVVASEASLFNHAGAGHQIKVNKAAATDTASLLFQTGFSGRAEMGTAGSDAFAIKVSADSVTWNTGLLFDPANGRAQAPSGLTVTGTLTGSAVTQTQMDTTPGRLMKVGDFGLGAVIAPLIVNIDDNTLPFGQYRTTAPSTTGTFPTSMAWGHVRIFGSNLGDFVQLFANVVDDKLFMRRYRTSAGGWQPWRTFWNTANTTVDANGFLREASPIVRLFNDQHVEPVETVGARFTRVGTGHYTLDDVAPLASEGWSVEIPRDFNGNREVFAEIAYDADTRCLNVRTSAPVWDGAWRAGDACDIPEGRWIDLRFVPNAPEEVPEDAEAL